MSITKAKLSLNCMEIVFRLREKNVVAPWVGKSALELSDRKLCLAQFLATGFSSLFSPLFSACFKLLNEKSESANKKKKFVA